jgi:hypothetical protein
MKASALEVFLTLIHSTLQSNKSGSSQIKRNIEESSSLLTCKMIGIISQGAFFSLFFVVKSHTNVKIKLKK